MKKSATPPQTPSWSSQLKYRLQDGVLIALAALCLFMWMALLTYDQADPGWTHASSPEQVHNAGGRFGAWCADVLDRKSVV